MLKERTALVATALSPFVGCAMLSLTSITLPGCPVRENLGVECPGCGATRCITALMRGDLIGALDYNALIPIIVVALILTAAMPRKWLLAVLSRMRSPRAWLSVTSASLLFWVLRIAPVEALYFLRAR